MSISSIPPNSNPYPAMQAEPRNQFRSTISALAKALNSGDLSGAQSAFAALQQMKPNSQAIATQTASNPMEADMQAVAKALQSGDLSAAKTAFAKLQQDMKSVHHKHHRNDNDADDVKSATAATQPTTSTSAVKDIDATTTGGQFGVTA